MLECPICFDEVLDNHRTPCCNNKIHKNCLNDCLREYHTCPLCRECYRVVEIEVNKLDKQSKIWMGVGLMFIGGVVSALFNIIYCNRVHGGE